MGLLDRVMLKKARFENEETPPELLPQEPEPEVPVDPDADLDRQLCWLPDTNRDGAPSRVKVVSYNVLGRCNADGMHAKSHPSSLTWSFRRQRLLNDFDPGSVTVPSKLLIGVTV